MFFFVGQKRRGRTWTEGEEIVRRRKKGRVFYVFVFMSIRLTKTGLIVY